VAVVFRVKNLDSKRAAKRVPYRVTISGGGQTLSTSAGNDTLSVGPGESRTVVFTGDVEGTQPESAEVQLYPDGSMFVAPDLVPDASLWEVTNVRFDCAELSVQCQVTGDLTLSAEQSWSVRDIHVVAHEGDISGRILAAGRASATVTEVNPGQRVPFSGYVTGFDQPEPKSGAELPPGLIQPEVSVVGG
jgi:hypothetical protein